MSLKVTNGVEMDSKCEEKWFFHLLGFFAPILVIISNIIGGIWTISGTILTLGIYPILDGLLGEDKPTKKVPKSGIPYETMLHIHSLIHPLKHRFIHAFIH